jgi:hypothetical protein
MRPPTFWRQLRDTGAPARSTSEKPYPDWRNWAFTTNRSGNFRRLWQKGCNPHFAAKHRSETLPSRVSDCSIASAASPRRRSCHGAACPRKASSCTIANPAPGHDCRAARTDNQLDYRSSNEPVQRLLTRRKRARLLALLAFRDSLGLVRRCPKLRVDRTGWPKAKTDAVDPGCVKTTSQIEIVSGFSETIDATVH